MKKSSNFITLICLGALALMTSCKQSDKKAEDSALTTEQVKDIATDGFVYGLPLVMNYAIMNEYAIDTASSQFKAPFNQIKSIPRVYTYKDVAILSPNSDTPYSVSFLDLRAEPVIITVPEVAKNRYYSVQLVDGNTYNQGYIGTRATGNEGGTYAVVGPGWKGETPKGVKKVFRSTTPFMLSVFRTQLFEPKELTKRG